MAMIVTRILPIVIPTTSPVLKEVIFPPPPSIPAAAPTKGEAETPTRVVNVAVAVEKADEVDIDENVGGALIVMTVIFGADVSDLIDWEERDSAAEEEAEDVRRELIVGRADIDDEAVEDGEKIADDVFVEVELLDRMRSLERAATAVPVVVDDDDFEDSREGEDNGLVPTVDVASDVAVLVTEAVAVTDELLLAISVRVNEVELEAVKIALAVLLCVAKLDAVKIALAELLCVAELVTDAVFVLVSIEVWVVETDVDDVPVIIPDVVIVLLAIVDNDELDEGVLEKQAVRVAVSVEFLSYENDTGGDLEILVEAEEEAELLAVDDDSLVALGV